MLSVALALPSQGPPPRPNCIKMTPEKEEQIDLIVAKLGAFLNNLTIEHENFDIRLIKLSIEQHSDDEVEEKETVLQLSVNDCQLSDDEIDEIEHHREKAKEQGKEKETKEELKESKKGNGKDDSKEGEVLRKKQEIPKKDEPLKVADEGKVEISTKKQQKQETKENSCVDEQKQVETSSKKQEQQKDNQNDQEAKTSTEHENRKGSEISKDESKPQESVNQTNSQEVERINGNEDDGETGKNFELMYLDLDENGQKLFEAMGKKKKGPKIVYVQERNSGQTEYWFLKRR